MSNHSQIVVDLDVSAREANVLADSIRDWLISEGIIENTTSDCALGDGYRPGARARTALAEDDDSWRALVTNGLEIRIGRQVFEASGNGIELACASCHAEFSPEDDWFDAVGRWHEGDDAVTFDCPSCGRRALLDDWEGPWRWAFGNLGFEFWNWPPLSDDFLRALSAKLGHRTAVVRRHL